jgi:ParB-like chromosome segregation protein Spo0J
MATVHAYAQAMTEQQREGGLRFPAIVLFSDDSTYWLADGYHRVLAAREAGLEEILAEVHPGTGRDALLYAISANTDHGLPRTNADKRRAVLLLLNDPEWSQWNDREIARRCQVGNNLVSRARKSLSVLKAQMRERKVRRGDQVYEMAVPQAQPEPVQENALPAAESAVASAAEAATKTDRLGLAIPAARLPVFAAAADFAEARQLFARLAEVLDRIAQQPGGAVYRQQLSRKVEGSQVIFESARLREALSELEAAEPYCGYCPLCQVVFSGFSTPACRLCQGRGWTTEAAFAACPEGHRQAVLQLRERKAG